MNQKVEPYSNSRVIVVGILAATFFAIMSMGFLILQATGNDDHIAGRILSVDGAALVIQGARGDVTELVLPTEFELRGVQEGKSLVVGQHVMVRGTFETDGQFSVERLRLIEGPPKR